MPRKSATTLVKTTCAACGETRLVQLATLRDRRGRPSRCRVCQGRAMWGARSAPRAAEGLRLSEAPRTPAPAPTPALVGTTDKIEVMRSRYFAGLHLHHPDDGPAVVRWEEVDEVLRKHMTTLNTARRTRHYRRKHEALGTALETSKV